MNTFDEIDFADLYRRHMEVARRRPRTGRDWDERASALSREVFDQPYVRQFTARLDLEGCRTLLDVGAGPGTIAVTVADRLDHVYALDYSEGMLAACRDAAAARGLANVTTILRAWEDDWSDVPVCDVAVASRSTLVADLDAALTKLMARARRRVYLTSIVGGRVLDEELLRALGRDDPPSPDYIYVLALLHRRGIHPRLDYIEGAAPASGTMALEEFRRRVEWALGPLDDGQRDRLERFHGERGGQVGLAPQRWAFIWWEMP